LSHNDRVCYPAIREYVKAIQGEIMSRKIAFLILLVFACTLFAAAQQDKSKRPSPPASAECKLADGKAIKSDYSSPRMKGRKIYGGLVPYDKVWRTGANEATTFVTDTALTVGGKDVPAGSYTLFTIPSADKWTMILSKKTGEWGTDYPGEGEDLLRADMKVEKLGAPVENFTISFHQHGNACMMRINWETTGATVELAEKK
jgi:hypothetical protein